MQNLLRGYRFLALPIRVAPVYGTILYYTRAYVAQAKSGKKQALCTSPAAAPFFLAGGDRPPQGPGPGCGGAYIAA